MTNVKIGDVNSFVSRINELKAAHKRKCLKEARKYERIAAGKITKTMAKKRWFDNPEGYKNHCLNQAASLKCQAENFTLPIKFFPKRKYFKNYKNSCGFDPMTGEGHSYEWYALTKVINGKLVLNTYRYSIQTSKHINNMRSLFKTLGLTFVEVEAPRGLQNLHESFCYLVKALGKVMIRQNHAVSSNYKGTIQYCKKQLKTLQSLGFKFTQKEVDDKIKQMIEKDDQERKEAKARGVKLRAERRALKPAFESVEAVSLV